MSEQRVADAFGEERVDAEVEAQQAGIEHQKCGDEDTQRGIAVCDV